MQFLIVAFKLLNFMVGMLVKNIFCLYKTYKWGLGAAKMQCKPSAFSSFTQSLSY